MSVTYMSSKRSKSFNSVLVNVAIETFKTFTKAHTTYRKIPIISPGAYFWSKGLFEKFFLGGLIFGGRLIHGRIFAF